MCHVDTLLVINPYGEYFPSIVASTTMEGCMESGLDVLRGGAKYNSTGFTACGIGNVGDSLYVIKKLCFDEKSVSTRELYDALCANWKGYEDLQKRIDNEVAHYGNGIEEVDELTSWAVRQFTDKVNSCTNPRGGHWRPGSFTMATHIQYGRETCATPDGRSAFTPLAEAISPRQGFDKNGPTQYMLSASRLPHLELGNGTQLNIKFSPAAVAGPEGTRTLKELISTYFDLTGMQVQFNVIDTESLHDAQKHPDNYRDLIVRIAGFSVYFTEMAKAMQDDFITRTEHMR